MRKFAAVLVVGFFTASLCYAASHTKDKNLHHMIHRKPEIKLYLGEVKCEAKDERAEAEAFKKVFSEVLPTRVTHKYVIVKSASEADFVIEAIIDKYSFIERAIPSPLGGTGALVADTLAPKSSANITVDYRILDGKTGKLVSHFENFATEARMPIKDMEAGKGYEEAVEKNIERLLNRAFRKPRRRDHWG